MPRLGRTALQFAAAVIAAGAWWLYHTISVHGLATSSVDLIPAQLVLGIGIGMIVAPLFDFILAAVTDDEVGSASGVVNAMQQLGGAVGVAVFGTVFFSVLGRDGFTAAIERCLLIELGIAPVLALLAGSAARQPRDPEALPAERPNSANSPTRPLPDRTTNQGAVADRDGSRTSAARLLGGAVGLSYPRRHHARPLLSPEGVASVTQTPAASPATSPTPVTLRVTAPEPP